MKKHVAIKWVTALRSKQFKQGQSYLCSVNKYCCLGVLCEIAPKNLKLKKEKGGGVTYFNGEKFDIPYEVQEWADMRTNYGQTASSSLSNMNDTGSSFSEIADYIERNWKFL